MRDTMRLEELNKKRVEIREQINSLYESAYNIYECDEMKLKLDELYAALNNLNNEIMNEQPIIASNSIVDLRKRDKLTYLIYIHGKKTIVGTIEYREYHCSDYIGDIEYSIYEDFQGNNYAYYALCALAEYLHSINIPDFWISTYKENIPSFKTIKKYGGDIVKEDEKYVLFECKTSRSK